MVCQLSRDRVSVWNEEKVLEVECDDGHTRIWRYLVPLNCAVKND